MTKTTDVVERRKMETTMNIRIKTDMACQQNLFSSAAEQWD